MMALGPPKVLFTQDDDDDDDENVPASGAGVPSLTSQSSQSYFFQAQGSLVPDRKARSALDHVCRLNIDEKTEFLRQTNIVCTIGPSCESPEMIGQMISQGMNVVRLDLTLGTFKYHGEVIKRIRTQEQLTTPRQTIAIAVDVSCPTVRTGLVEGDKRKFLVLEEGDKITLTGKKEFAGLATKESVWLDTTFFPNFFHALNPNDQVYLDEGALTLIVREKEEDSSRCLVVQGGKLFGSVRVHIPRSNVYKHAVRDRYLQGCQFAVENAVDFLYLSFIERGSDVQRVRDILGSLGQQIQIVARIETKTAALNIDEIMDAADGILLSRGDLALEMAPQKVFIVQKSIIAKCQMRKIPVIVASQMMESMRDKPRPTRAEVSDVANAVLDGADGLMLTVETAMGNYPVETLNCMHRVCREAEAAIFYDRVFLEIKRIMPSELRADPVHTAALAAVEASLRSNAAGIIVVTTTGKSAHMISSYRPRCPVVTVTRREQVARQCHLYRGLHPVWYQEEKVEDWAEDMDNRINFAIERGRSRGFFKTNDPLVIVHGWYAGTGSTNTVRIFDVPPAGTGGLMVVRSQHKFEVNE